MKVSHAILTVIFAISLVLAEHLPNSAEQDQVVLKRPRREQRKLLGIFTNNIVESPDLKKKFDSAIKQVQSFVGAIKGQKEADILALPNLDAVVDTEGFNNESGKNMNAPESIKGPLLSSVTADSLEGKLDDETGNNIDTKNNVDEPESVEGSLLSSVENLDHARSTEKSLGESERADEVSRVSLVEAESKLNDRDHKIVAEDSKKDADSDVDTDDIATMKKELLVSIEDGLNEIRSDVDISVYARGLVSTVTSLLVKLLNLVLSLVFIIIKIILPFPLNWLFGWIINIIVG